MKILLISICYNEEILLPHFLKHYSFCDDIIIFDNDSTDRSRVIMESNNKCTIKGLHTDDKIIEPRYTNIKNEYWKECRNHFDWVIVCDIDEFICHPDMLNLLGQSKFQGYTILSAGGYQMVGEKTPNTESTLFEQINKGYSDTVYSKCVIFDPKKVNSIGYAHGCHICRPTGKIKVMDNNVSFKLLHYKYLSEDYFLERSKILASRLSEYNIKNKLGNQYLKSDEELRKEYREALKKRRKIL